MTESKFEILMFVTPILLAILGFIGALGVKALIDINKSVNELKVNFKEVITKHDNLEHRVTKIEDKIY